MAKGASMELEVDELLGATPQGIEELVGDLWYQAHLADDSIRLPARKMLMEMAVYYSIERMWEFKSQLGMEPSEIVKKYPNHPILMGMQKLQTLKDDYEKVVYKLYEWLEYITNITTRQLAGDKEMRVYFSQLVGYKAIPPFDEYETMRRGDKERIIAALKSKIDLHFGTHYSQQIQRVFKRARAFETASGYNAVRLSNVNPELYAKMEAEMQAEE